ncbi:hypothetical protein [Pseudobacteriovorax antillogorgiicola]|uniref:Uncharacterized protein n=1 Tax=Pseudobacteriovorax antillogorgiicola TaxID=1513793 RepID=A0A1Y6CDS0_9BACT|nr:hypothetical protein [Pseudobacteriovorax antillogorgiicola]TCS51798.1 hypothetical protein EDD56_110183 [Pseudobacteriovorax antillogorgiicola]SMF50063.1 hypothetical protein SAMN06296036_115152 [Pseudobacteriovorax antillogorgiicola]
MKRQGIYWLVDHPSPLHEERSALLEELDFVVTFYSNFEDMYKDLLVKRVSIILIGDELDPEQVRQAMDQLAGMPDIQGARLLLSLSKANDELCFYASCYGFRDIIPLSLDESDWLHRFQFSTASNNEMSQLSAQQGSTVNDSIAVGIPARITWINGEEIWLESKARPYLGDGLRVSGPLADEMGSQVLNLKVKSQESKNLAYRFSEAAVCSWEADQDAPPENVEHVINELKKNNRGDKKKVFLAMQSPALRNAIMKYLDPKLFDVHSALQKKSLISEPKYFTPSLVFIEYRLCEGEAMGRFQDMVAQTPDHSTVVLVGAKKEDVAKFHNFALGRNIEALFQIPKNLPDLIQSKYLKTKNGSSGQNIHISRSHRYTFCEINLDARLERVGGDFFQIRIPMGLANYGLVKLILKDGQTLFAKVVGSTTPKKRVEGDEQSEESHDHTITCRVNWINSEHKSKAVTLINNR